MSTLNTLKLTLAPSNKDGKIEYTTAERNTAKAVALCVLQALSIPNADGHKESPLITEGIIAAVNLAGEAGQSSVPGFMKSAFKHIMNNHFSYEKGMENGEEVKYETSDDVKNWPKCREYSSVCIMLRSALNELRIVDQTTLNEWFPTYSAKKVVRRA
jgi:hypothetical protein